MPAAAHMVAAEARISKKFRWTPGSADITGETSTWTLSLEKNPEPSQPSE